MASKPPVVMMLCTFMLVCAGGFLQWRSAMLQELELSKRQGKHFEQMFRDVSDDSKEWEKKYTLVKTQLDRITHKTRELETSKHTVSEQKLKAEQGIKDLQQKIAGQEKKASELSKLAEEEAKAHDEAAHSAEQCSRDLKAKAAEATSCSEAVREAEDQAAKHKSGAEKCQSEKAKLQELLDGTKAKLAKAQEERDRLQAAAAGGGGAGAAGAGAAAAAGNSTKTQRNSGGGPGGGGGKGLIKGAVELKESVAASKR